MYSRISRNNEFSSDKKVNSGDSVNSVKKNVDVGEGEGYGTSSVKVADTSVNNKDSFELVLSSPTADESFQHTL